MKAQEALISVRLVDHPVYYPQEAWDIQLDHLDMYTEEVLEELAIIRWAETSEWPTHSTVSANTTQHNWGASGSFSEIIMQVSTGAMGGVGAAAIAGSIKAIYAKLRARSQGETWSNIPSAEEASRLAKSRLHLHYDVAMDKLTVSRSDIDAEAERYDFNFVHEDGRKFGATVGAAKGIPSCTRVWMETAHPILRPTREPQQEEG
ncbi:hypothetical protein ACFYU9_09240 [Streptomyces sp. NPDC004327]|uniref:hypothetical protein n=1 Tax=Streptomyces sp. NPDC004327 TaxID=3364699 RepID=UPI0036A7F0A4